MLALPVQRHTLDNGLKVVLSPDSSAPIVAVNLWYGVGSRNEPRGLTGFAHLFEHMMFQGSEHVAKGRHFELVERAGGSSNATTWFDRTNYYETLPSHQLELALWLESDRMGWMLPAMTQEKLDNQRDVVKNEKRERHDNRPYGDWDERLQRLAYPEDHPYHHSVIGSMDDLDAASLDDVASFFRTFYVPSNAVLTLCGDFESERALALVARYFGDIPAGSPRPALPGRPELPVHIGGTVRERVVGDVPLPRVIAAFRVPPYLDSDFHVAELAGCILGVGRASRLYRSLVRERRVAKDVVTYVFPLVTGAALFLAWATGYEGSSTESLEEALTKEIRGLAKLEEVELRRALAVSEIRLVEEIERLESRADLLSMFETHFGDADRLNSELDRLRSVTAPRIQEFTETYLDGHNQVLLSYEPQGRSREASAGPTASG